MKPILALSLILAASLIAGCATSPASHTSSGLTSKAYKAFNSPSAAPSTISLEQAEMNVCRALGDYERNVRDMRNQGVSREQSKALMAIALQKETADEDTKIRTGTNMMMTINHVYDGKPGTAADRCVAERWPLMTYLVTR